MHADLEKVIAALEPLSRGGTFAARRSVDANHLDLSVKGLGRVDFPLSAATARALVAQAVQSPFGWGERTVVDRSVRDGWQIAKSRLKIDGRHWNPVLRETVAELSSALGLPPSTTLVPKLDKMTIYGPGQFFKPHKDTEKTDVMIGSLVVLLPSRHTGGALRIEHGERRFEVRRVVRRAPKIEVVAFYADCVHEVRPVRTGYRVALVYALEVRDGPTTSGKPGRTATLRRAMQAYFENAPRGQDKLVYLLDHEYTARNLGWSRLKGADGPRVRAMREVADALKLDASLCLARIDEHWHCEVGFSARDVYGRRHDDEDEADVEDEDDVIPVDLLDFQVEFKAARGRDGSRASLEGLHVGESEVCASTPNSALKPQGSHYEGYMGNYGSTLDRWYERAAVVLWPRSRAFAMEVEADPACALRTVLDGFRESRPAAHEQLSILLERIEKHRVLRTDTVAWTSALELAVVSGEESTARALLEPLAPRFQSVPMRAVKPFVALLDRYGEAFGRALLSAWHTDEWGRFVYLPKWIARVVSTGRKAGKAVATIIACEQVDTALKELDFNARHRSRSPYAPHEVRGERGETARIIQALRTCVAADAREPYRRCVAALVGTRLPLGVLDMVTVALAVSAPDSAAGWVRQGAKRLLKAAERELDALAQRMDRRPDHWVIEIPDVARGRDCKALHAFLRSSETTVEMPLNKERRKHLHRKIDAAGLPVKHVTRRTGRPFVLVLEKQASLHTRDRALRKKALAQLKRVRARLRDL